MNVSVTDLSNSIWINQLNQSTLVSIPEIAYWTRSFGIGALNSLIYTSFDIDSTTLEIVPSFGLDEASILSQLYVLKFIQLQIDSLIGASGLVGNEIIEFSENGHTIRKNNRNEISKSWITLKSQAQSNLDQLISSYKINRATPRQVVGIDGSCSAFGLGWYDAYNRAAYRYGGV